MGPHVLVDLHGHSALTRLTTFSLRPAAVQISYMGFGGVIGASYIAYTGVDRVAVAPEFQQ
jgi:predicted O-linked N-acetylglucosamine transferase (SPINDLY family)